MTRASLVFALLLFSPLAHADARDPAAAREHLKIGYDLKREGRCDEAIPHFAESARLNPTAKALLNEADCDEELGKLVAAQERWIAGRDLARAQGDALAPYAEQRLAALDKKMPRLTVKLAANAPAGSVVLRDGVALGAVSLGVELPIDPGDHVVTLRAPGIDERTWSVKLHEGDHVTIEATPTPPPGPELQPLPPPVKIDVAPPRASHDPLAPETWEPSPFYTVATPGEHTLRWLGWTFEGAGAVCAIASVALFVRSASRVDDIQNGGFATSADIASARDAASTERGAAIGLAIGAVAFVAAGLPFLLGGGEKRDDDARVRFGPRGVVF